LHQKVLPRIDNRRDEKGTQAGGISKPPIMTPANLDIEAFQELLRLFHEALDFGGQYYLAFVSRLVRVALHGRNLCRLIHGKGNYADLPEPKLLESPDLSTIASLMVS